MTKTLFTCSILAFVLLVNVSAIDKATLFPGPKCAVLCHDNIKQPVCAQLGSEFRIFQNDCQRMNTNCNEGVNWDPRPMNDCSQGPKCAVRCNVDFIDPVCAQLGSEFRIFDSDCQRMSTNCNEDVDWVLRPMSDCERRPTCYVRCNLDTVDPMCAQLGSVFKIFDNDCQRMSTNCNEDVNWEPRPMSDCL